MKFTDKTKNIKFIVTNKVMKRDLDTVSKVCIPVGNLTFAAERIMRDRGVSVATPKIWEDAREMRNRARGINGRIIRARTAVATIMELAANAIGSNISAVKHALETNHDIRVERGFKMADGEATEAAIYKLNKEGVRVSFSNGTHYKHKSVMLDIHELVANVDEQASSYYKRDK